MSYSRKSRDPIDNVFKRVNTTLFYCNIFQTIVRVIFQNPNNHSMQQPHEQQIQVVIRIKPQQDMSPQQKCVYLSNKQRDQLVVETPCKKEYFVFDQIADETCSQSELFNKIGNTSLDACAKGYNCCIFAYGQTGAGKTYSVLGKPDQISNNIYSETRGILPRLLDKLFLFLNEETDRSHISCSYMEIYNEQIIDLLNPQSKTKQIRQDLKRGVFVEGITVEKASSYQNSMQLLMRGIKNRKVAATAMNDQSSRSHTIFTMTLDYQVKDGQSMKLRKSKINIVDLAGSQRTKHAKVEGQRLRQGCNINKSLHVLGNVINALVESSKKKKHIPYRDSKLTYYLKDSLGGNSVTKLLANIDPSKKYLGDTLSTLMFAKRAKIIRMKVQVNQKSTETFQSLRNQIRKLRGELAEAKYIKTESKLYEPNSMVDNSDSDQAQATQKISIPYSEISEFDTGKDIKTLEVFEQNQLNYKILIEIYEEHLRLCSMGKSEPKAGVNVHHQWKMLHKKIQALNGLVRNFPAFTRIFKQNLCLRSDIEKNKKRRVFSPHKGRPNTFQKTYRAHQFKKSLEDHARVQAESFVDQEPIQNGYSSTDTCVLPINRLQHHQNENETERNNKSEEIYQQQLTEVVSYYQKLLSEFQKKTVETIDKLQEAYNDLIKENKEKDNKIKELKKRKQYPPEISSLMNQNQYLKLNILELQQQIDKLAETQTKHQIQLRTKLQEEKKKDETESDIRMTRAGNQPNSLDKLLAEKQREWEKQKAHMLKQILQNLEEIRFQAEAQMQAVEEDKNFAQTIMVQLREELIKYKLETKQTKMENEYLIFTVKELKKRLRDSTNFPEESSLSVSQNLKHSGKDLLVISLQVPTFQQFQRKKSRERSRNRTPKSNSQIPKSSRSGKQVLPSNHCLSKFSNQLQKQHSPNHNRIMFTSTKHRPPLDDNKVNQNHSKKNLPPNTSIENQMMAKQIMQLHQQYASEIQELKQKIKQMDRDSLEYQQLKYTVKEEFTKSIHEIVHDYRNINPNSIKRPQTSLQSNSNKLEFKNRHSLKSPRVSTRLRGDYNSQNKEISEQDKKKDNVGNIRGMQRDNSQKELKIPPKFKF